MQGEIEEMRSKVKEKDKEIEEIATKLNEQDQNTMALEAKI